MFIVCISLLIISAALKSEREREKEREKERERERERILNVENIGRCPTRSGYY